jgi:hypothetical protein
MLIACGLDRLEPTVNGFWPDDYSTIASSLDLHLSTRSATTLTLLRKHAPSSVYTDFIWANILRSHIKRHVDLGAQTRFCGSRYSQVNSRSPWTIVIVGVLQGSVATPLFRCSKRPVSQPQHGLHFPSRNFSKYYFEMHTPPKIFISHDFFHCENFFFESISKKWLKSYKKSKKSCNFYDHLFCKVAILRFPDPSGPGNVQNCQNTRKSRKSPKSPKSPKSAPPDRTHPIDHFLAALLVLIPVALREVRATPFSVAIFERFRAGGRFGKSGSSWKYRY